MKEAIDILKQYETQLMLSPKLTLDIQAQVYYLKKTITYLERRLRDGDQAERVEAGVHAEGV